MDAVVGRGGDHTAWAQAPATVSSAVHSGRALPPPALPAGLGSASVADAATLVPEDDVAAEAAASSEGNATGHFVVRCKGLPFSASADTVTCFFDPLVRPPARAAALVTTHPIRSRALAMQRSPSVSRLHPSSAVLWCCAGTR